ncbi:MAG TPA: sigma-70 family RNA polymerase sigma factor [Caldimonas sp.]|jgi:RNA polymerase sigma-70 factor (ECF subfamily)|nr:sigma-70 family RNA polymerase sigma factor [Caldimonas sp.]HEX4234029.1 sigma-70 family RNA polymerase sigma factor [Caldimonas sp.]
MGNDADWRRFEQLAMPHLDAAYNLAMWLTRNADDAQDVVQDALLRAMRYIDGLRLESARPWLLQIVRHTCYSWLRQNRPADHVSIDDAGEAWSEMAAPSTGEPPAIAIRRADHQQINDAIAALPVAYREAFVLRELEDLSYLEIARIAEIPIGTVMSRLARARGLMRNALAPAARPVLRTVGRSTQGGGA